MLKNFTLHLPTSTYLNALSNTGIPYFEETVNRIYLLELQLNKASASDSKVPFLDLHLSISRGFVSFKMYDYEHLFFFTFLKKKKIQQNFNWAAIKVATLLIYRKQIDTRKQ